LREGRSGLSPYGNAIRGALPPQQRVAFFVHVDEFQTFSSDAFATLLSEARKFATHFCLVNQFTDQLPHSVRSAVLGIAGSLIAFRVGGRDAELLAPEFHPMEPGALTDLSPFTAWLRRSDAGRDRITAEPKLYPAFSHVIILMTRFPSSWNTSVATMQRFAKPLT
jgi:hypothetical protein